MIQLLRLALLTPLALLFACQQDIPSALHIPKTVHTVSAQGGTVDIYLQTYLPSYSVRIEPADADWIEPVASKSVQLSVASFVCHANTSPLERSATIRFSSADGSVAQEVVVTQTNATKGVATIARFAFLVRDNPDVLLQDIEGTIASDGSISVYIPHWVSSKKLIPSIEYYGELVDSPAGAVDFSKTVAYTVKGKTDKKQYTVSVHANNGIPVLWIDTENRTPIASKDDYVNGTVVWDGNGLTPSLDTTAMKIKGRGNTTWYMSKKPYKIKFDKKQSMAGFPADKEWVLLANYSDKTSLRTELAFALSRNTDLKYTPHSQFCDVIINGQYAGVYQLSEQIKIAPDRVDVSDNGYLLEVDQPERLDPDDVSFRTSRILLCVKDPTTPVGSASYNFIKNYVNEAENVLYGQQFKDPENGYAKYMDVVSFADWYVVNEIARNNDAIFFSSCYMHIKPNGKLTMGPIWDFDLAFGNCNYNGNYAPEGFYIKGSVWINRLFEDPAFVAIVKQRFALLRNRQSQLIVSINTFARSLEAAKTQDEAKWHTLFVETWPNYVVLGLWSNEVAYLKDWFIKRMDWLDKEFGKM